MFALNWDIEKPVPPLFDRQPLRHTTSSWGRGRTTATMPSTPKPPRSGMHCATSATQSTASTTAAAVKRSQGWLGVVTGSTTSRGAASRAVSCSLTSTAIAGTPASPLRATESDAITAEEVEATLDAQGIRLEPGDILLLRFGWISWWSGASEAEREALHVQLPERSYLDGPRVLLEEIPPSRP